MAQTTDVEAILETFPPDLNMGPEYWRAIYPVRLGSTCDDQDAGYCTTITPLNATPLTEPLSNWPVRSEPLFPHRLGRSYPTAEPMSENCCNTFQTI